MKKFSLKICLLITLALGIIGVYFSNFGLTEVASIFGILWYCGIIGTCVYAAIHFVRTVINRRSAAPAAPTALRSLPLPSDAHQVLACFCQQMQALDTAMPYCSYAGKAMLLGGGGNAGKGYAYFNYTKDWPLQIVWKNMGYDVPVSHRTREPGWSIGGYEDDWIYLNSENVTGYGEWSGYDSLKRNECDDSGIEKQWDMSIRATIQNEWPRAVITRCAVQCANGTMTYQVDITT